jgi:hypothetical protein
MAALEPDVAMDRVEAKFEISPVQTTVPTKRKSAAKAVKLSPLPKQPPATP